ncbi:ABC transporter permease [Sporosalibacterium faouarense]|uniref:ABC transporter permease n=1 Tax=Sporosalibacterium faouarense TaxID=516123 RepID=UPI00192C6F44|nr:ABC transporter permease [Sporosalibacterium faouarense]
MNSRIKSLIKKEFIQFFRDKALVMLVIYIFLEVAICGWALFMEVKNLPTAVYDMDKSQYSRNLVENFSETENFNIKYYVNDYNEIERLLDRGRASIAIVIPKDFSLNIIEGRQSKVQLLADGSNSNTATLAISYGAKIIRKYSRNIEIERLGISKNQISLLPSVNSLVNSWYNPGLNFTHFNLVSMVAIAAIFTGVLLASGAVVREKEVGTLEQLMVTPIKSYELIIAKILPMGIVKMFGLAVGVLISVFLFDVPVRGSLILFFLLSTLLFFTAMGVGVLIATVSKNMQQSLLLSFFVLFPIMFLSGTVVPISSMPVLLQWLSYLSPLRYYMNIVVGIFLKGVGLDVLWSQALSLGVIGSVIFLISSLRFKNIMR